MSMRDAGAVQIDELIVHIVDPRGAGIILSEAPLPLTGDDPLYEYFQNHITSALGHRSATAARFKSIEDENPSGFCAGMFAGSVEFVPGSRAIAHRLYAILERDGRTRGADLAICWYRAEALPEERLLAMLKLDAAQVFRHRIETDDLGRSYVNFVPEPEAFTRERLQKAAFIRALEPRNEAYDMILLDRQVADHRRRDVARYFAEAFLQTEEAYDARQRTEMLYRGVIVSVNELRAELSPDEVRAIDDQLQAALAARQFDLEAWLTGLPVSDPAREKLSALLVGALPDRAFAIDPEWGSRLVRRRVFLGDYGLRLQVAGDHFDDLLAIQYVAGEAGRRPYYRVTIETERWDEVRR